MNCKQLLKFRVFANYSDISVAIMLVIIENDHKKAGSGRALWVERLDNKILYQIMMYTVQFSMWKSLNLRNYRR